MTMSNDQLFPNENLHNTYPTRTQPLDEQRKQSQHNFVSG